ncbi:hypothetical protein Tsp_03979 [Trichinella spiralis]|uniref:hypothetical protein n=1 Tax=Trichinella spiralis TaxID=6334 RepID=UPI0001EFCAE4|nr:hypothetical protein Tsp_03979 [Trichinella spiralis]
MNCLKGREKSTVNNNLVDSLKRIRPNLFIRRLESESIRPERRNFYKKSTMIGKEKTTPITKEKTKGRKNLHTTALPFEFASLECIHIVERKSNVMMMMMMENFHFKSYNLTTDNKIN